MKVSLEWLRTLVPGLEGSPEEISERLASLGFPVEEWKELGAGLGDIVIGRVEEAGPHPNADRLSLCRVFDGEETVDVVCGAPNVRAGALYPFAPVGAVLPGGMKIGRAKIRGTVSNGMLCSARELELGEDHDGILELDGDFAPGASFVDSLGLADVMMDVEITANRGDMLSHLGVAREAGYPLAGPVTLPEFPDTAGASFEISTVEREGRVGDVTVSIEDADRCPRYAGAVIEGVRIGPSPEWLQRRLRAVGSRPINNVVDATNYLLLELGHPMHAFDADRLRGGEVRVRCARPGETLRTLDGVDRTLDEEMLLICDGEGPIALGGVMGGENSEVFDETRTIFLECALFEPRSVRKTRKTLGMSTDASYRFERGVDPDGLERAFRRAVELIVTVAGGSVVGPAVDVRPEPFTRAHVPLRPGRIEQVLGIALETDTIPSLLEPLGFGVSQNGDGWTVEVPGHRSHDVTREIDLIEELARTYGYDRFPSEARPYRIGTVPDHPLFHLEDRVRTELAALGAYEVHLPAFAPESEGTVSLQNPISSNEGRLRSSVLPGVLRRVEYNLARGIESVRLFELGTAFFPSEPGELPVEEPRLAVALTGPNGPGHWSSQPGPVDLWDLKALAERAAALVAPGEGKVRPVEEPMAEGPLHVAFHIVDGSGNVLGRAGRVDDGAIETPLWAGVVWGLEVRLPSRPEAADDPVFVVPPTFPAVERDLALLVPAGVPAGDVASGIGRLGKGLLRDVGIFDVYEGEGIPEGTRSIAYRMRFQSEERTLTDEEVDGAVARILRGLKENFNVEPRS